MNRRTPRLWIFLGFAILGGGLLTLMALPSLSGRNDSILPPCQATLSAEQAQAQREKILSLPAIQRLVQESSRVELGWDCARADQYLGSLRLTLPANYSRFKVEYDTTLTVHLLRNDLDQINLTWSTMYSNQYLALDYQAITEKFRSSIEEQESLLPVQEYLTHLRPATAGLGDRTIHFTTETPASILSTYQDEVRSYYLPSSILWENFPEINQAYQIIRQHLLQGSLAECQLDQAGLFTSKGREVIDGKVAYRMRVDMQCPDHPRQAGMNLYPDGHYENLEIVWEGKAKP